MAQYQPEGASGAWLNDGNNVAGQRFSDLTVITSENVSGLEVACHLFSGLHAVLLVIVFGMMLLFQRPTECRGGAELIQSYRTYVRVQAACSNDSMQRLIADQPNGDAFQREMLSRAYFDDGVVRVFR